MATQTFTFTETLATLPPWITAVEDRPGSYQLAGNLPSDLVGEFSEDQKLADAIERTALLQGFNLGKVTILQPGQDPNEATERKPDMPSVEDLNELQQEQPTVDPGRAQTPTPPGDQAT